MKRMTVLLVALLILTLGAAHALAAEKMLRVAVNMGYNSEAAFEYYVEGLFGLDVPRAKGTTAGSRLTGDAKAFYEALKPRVEAIAAGEETSAEITVNVSYTDESSKLLKTIISALLSDCPYDLYWYDKTVGVMLSYGGDTSTFYFTVNKEYAAGEYEVDPTAVNAAKKAAANAKAIVAEFRGESDYYILKGYKERICDLVAYNHPAAEDSSTADSNAWQLIWVFDGNDSTDVVCEGYSKAFQYLCDMTDFDGSVRVLNVTGYMDGGAHMWNLVRMPNGKTYLVDVTNCDEGSVGADDLLFMVGYTSGSAEDGYIFSCDRGHAVYDISYVYDDAMFDVLGADALTVSDANYLDDNTWIGPVYTWTEDGSTCTARRYDAVNPDNVEEEIVSASYALGKMPTETTPGETIYTATFESDIFETQTQTLADIPALGEMDCLMLPESDEIIGEEAFLNAAMEAVLLPEGCKNVAARAFANCANLKFAFISESTRVADTAFDGSGRVSIYRY